MSKYFIATLCCLSSFFAAISQADTPTLSSQTEFFNLKIVTSSRDLNDLLDPRAQAEVIDRTSSWAEGPTVLSDKTIAWSDIPNNRVLKWNKKEGTQILLKPAQFQNGHAIDHQGRIVAASHGKRAIERLEFNGTWKVLVDLYEDKKLNSPNDLVIDRTGEIWFTDPTFGIDDKVQSYGGNSVIGGEFSYRFNPQTNKLVRLNTPEVKSPNGIAISPNQKTLYIVDSQIAHDPSNHSLNNKIMAYDIDVNKELKNGRTLYKVSDGIADGITVDAKGNIWATSGKYLHIISPNGTYLGAAQFPTLISNLIFSYEDQDVLYVTGERNLYRVPVKVTGIK